MLHRILALVVVSVSTIGLVAQDEKPAAVRCLAFAPDGQSLVVGLSHSDKGELYLRDVTKAHVKWREPQAAPVRAVVFPNEGKSLIAAVGASLVLIDSTTGKTTKTLGKHDKTITTLTLSSDGKSLASGGEDGVVKLWDIDKAESRKLHESAPLYSLAFAPDGKNLAWSAGREAGVMDVPAGKSLHKFTHDSFHVSCILFLPNGKEVITSGYDGRVLLHDLAGAKQTLIFTTSGVRGVGYAHATKTLALWTYESVELINFDRDPDADTKREIAALMARLDDDDFARRESAEAELVKIGFRAESALREAKTAKSAEVRIRTRRALQTLQSKPTAKIDKKRAVVAFAPSGEVVAIGGEDGVVGMYDRMGQLIK